MLGGAWRGDVMEFKSWAQGKQCPVGDGGKYLSVFLYSSVTKEI